VHIFIILKMLLKQRFKHATDTCRSKFLKKKRNKQNEHYKLLSIRWAETGGNRRCQVAPSQTGPRAA